MSSNELKHFKYVDRYKKNGEWIYVYPGDKAKKNMFGQIRGGTNSLQAHQRLNREATNQVAKNTPSRNVPGANDQTSTSGKQMSKLQQDKAKYMAEYLKKMNSAYGDSAVQKKANVDSGTKSWHKQQLNNASNVSRNTQKSTETTVSSNQLSKKDIKKAVFKAKVNTLKRDAAKAIERAKKWFDDLF